MQMKFKTIQNGTTSHFETRKEQSPSSISRQRSNLRLV